MSGQARPAWARESAVLRLGDGVGTVEVTPEWAFGGSTGAGVRVAVIDSGIDADHPMLDECVDRNGSVDVTVGDDGAIVVTPGPHGDVFGHGTACAGIIHALAPGARITSVRVLGPSLTGTAAAFHAGLVWAVDEGFDVINLSLGTTKRDWALAFHDVCDRAYFGGSFVVTAANNIARPSYPSLFASVASVACNTATDPLRFHANPEPPTEFLARGIDVEVPWTNGGTTTTTGNSFAAPHIAAFAALAKSKHPQLRPFQIKAALWATAANVREATAIEPAGRRGTMYSAGSRGTAMALVRPASTVAPSAAAPVSPVPDASSSPAPDLSRRRRAGVADGPVGPAVIEGIEIGAVSGRWRWGAVRAGRRVEDDRAVVLRELGGVGVSGSLVDTLERAPCDHPHIAPPLAVIQQPAMLVTATGPGLDPSDRSGAVAMALAATAAVAAAHARGVVHGDLGPSWLEVMTGGRVGLGGFGVASALSVAGAGTAAQLSIDAMARLAPEQLGDSDVTATVDVWALALLWCELLGGVQPWPSVDQVGALLRQRLSTPARPVAELVPDVPASLTSVLDRALQVHPTARPVDGGEFLTEVDTALAGTDLLRDAVAHPALVSDTIDAPELH